MNNKTDIFDRIMSMPILKIFRPFYCRYKTLLVYLFLGGCATIVGFSTRALFIQVLRINSYIGIALSWIISTSFAFLTNRTWIFEHNDSKITQEYFKFCGGRLFTFFLDEVINGILYEGFHMNFYVVFLISAVVEAVLNYIISKFLVFKK